MISKQTHFLYSYKGESDYWRSPILVLEYCKSKSGTFGLSTQQNIVLGDWDDLCKYFFLSYYLIF